MIIKSFEIKKIDIFKKKLILFYGQNEGLKDENIFSSKFLNIVSIHMCRAGMDYANLYQTRGLMGDRDGLQAVLKGDVRTMARASAAGWLRSS